VLYAAGRVWPGKLRAAVDAIVAILDAQQRGRVPEPH
jgi:hypothetical protein